MGRRRGSLRIGMATGRAGGTPADSADFSISCRQDHQRTAARARAPARDAWLLVATSTDVDRLALRRHHAHSALKAKLKKVKRPQPFGQASALELRERESPFFSVERAESRCLVAALLRSRIASFPTHRGAG